VKAKYALMQALNDDDLSQVINCTFTYDSWQNLIITHEGTSQVKKKKFDLLNSQYDSFYMFDVETIDSMLNSFTTVTNGLVSLGNSISNDQIVRKIIRALLKSWEVKATTLKKLNDKEEMDFTAFMVNLKTHKMEMKVRDEREPQKKRDVLFKASSSKSKKDEDDENLPNN